MADTFFTFISDLAVQLSGKLAGKSFTLKFDLADDGVYRLLVQEGECAVDREDAAATATVKMQNAQDAIALLNGTLKGRISLNTPAPLTASPIWWVYWHPKSRTTIESIYLIEPKFYNPLRKPAKAPQT